MFQYGFSFACMALYRCCELQPTVLVLRVVPAREGQHPFSGLVDRRKAVDGVVRPILAGAKQRFCVGIVVAHPGSAERGCDTQAAQGNRPFQAVIPLPINERYG